MSRSTVGEQCTECLAPIGADHMSWCDKNGGPPVIHGDCVYPYLKLLDDGRRVIVDRFDGRIVVYELGPIDWKTTILMNPDMSGKMFEVLGSLLEKLTRKL